MALTRAAVFGISAGAYRRHELHARERAFVESNCYVDVVIELLHAAGLEPLACLGFCLELDFEGDQFRFFKQPPEDVRALYGVEIFELNLYRPLIDHALTQVARGNLVLAEVDSFYLPDTSATDYKRNHVKTTIGIERVDRDKKQLGYFHNAGYYTLDGADFDGLFMLEPAVPPTHLPPYVELVRYDRKRALGTAELAGAALRLLREHLARRPAINPISAFRVQLAHDLEWLFTEELATYHLYAFSCLRQLGASTELLALHLRWLEQNGGGAWSDAAAAFDTVAANAKTLILKLARAVNAKRQPDVAALLSGMEAGWDDGMRLVAARLGA
jgi:hypothetical protein